MNTLKTFLYMGFMHGFFTFYFPYQLASRDVFVFNTNILSYLAIPFFLIGTIIIIWCSVDMVKKGLGTPAHVDPPKKLIINGLYHYVRNPIYLGALLVLLGYILWFGSGLMVIYFFLFLLAYQILITLIEEPVLRNMFGKGYEEYCQKVPRWIPRIVWR
ncbi:MAG: isoprenylcysteine carboxylmethyltransferase family protein [Anaerolineales bacterium]|nr:isoprenylcysteine carboxylmethyltransferase family protein [Anaerolineales bacterium]